ncbi:hypothetical protein [Bacillus sp. AFS041924]|uniref:hypothetical protein n=1 Tax=Bacillus sp. AFS041924 TaxID=2033503 RepID=UPI000BFD7959|nr:hypothetical protein [Bacillus sp. AFS041924]PGS48649.1 hypothetical protein COC46_17190 [Bacillus sp. AFS041924]
MDKHFIILEPFHQQVTCCCPGQKHQHMIEFSEGDLWTMTSERKYVDCLGWHYLIDNNSDFEFYLHVEDIESLYESGVLCSIWDIDLKINHLNFKINEALDVNDRESFLSIANDLRSLKEIKNKYFTNENVF